MPRTKKSDSPVLTKAETRAAGLEAVDPQLALGGDLKLSAFKTAIADTRSKLNAYNGLLSQVDSAYNDFLVAERTVADLSERMLAGVAAIYGKDSNEYEQAGGVRKSERKAPQRKAKPAA